MDGRMDGWEKRMKGRLEGTMDGKEKERGAMRPSKQSSRECRGLEVQLQIALLVHRECVRQ